MKQDEAFELAIQWRDNPVLLVGDMRASFDWLWKNSNEAADAVSRATGARVMAANLVPEALERLIPLHKALTTYAILLKAPKLTPELLDPVIESLALPNVPRVSDAGSPVASPTTESFETRTNVPRVSDAGNPMASPPTDSFVTLSNVPRVSDAGNPMASPPTDSFVTLTGLSAVTQAIEVTQRWVDKQERLRNGEGNRSEILKTTIEVADDELLVKTDQDGSLKLRGSTNIPMFLAFFRTAKHHLTIDAFLDIDRTVKPTNLDRHRVRLSSKLHDVMIEIVTEKDGYRMQKFRSK